MMNVRQSIKIENLFISENVSLIQSLGGIWIKTESYTRTKNSLQIQKMKTLLFFISLIFQYMN